MTPNYYFATVEAFLNSIRNFFFVFFASLFLGTLLSSPQLLSMLIQDLWYQLIHSNFLQMVRDYFFRSDVLFNSLIVFLCIICFFYAHSMYLEKHIQFQRKDARRLSFWILFALTCAPVLIWLYNQILYLVFHTSDPYTGARFEHVSFVFRAKWSFVFGLLALFIYNFALLKKTWQRTRCKEVHFLFGIAFLFSILFFFNNSLAGDGSEYFSWVRAFVNHGDFNFAEEGKYVIENGLRSNIYGMCETRLIGPALWVLPTYVAHGLSLWLENYSSVFEANGWTLLYLSAACFTTVFFVYLGVYLLYLIASEFVGPRIAYLGTLFMLMGTPLFTYAFLQPTYIHGIDFFICSLFLAVWYFDLGKRLPRGYFFLGLAYSLAVLSREQNSAFAIFLVAELFLLFRNHSKSTSKLPKIIKSLLSLSIGFLIPVALVKAFVFYYKENMIVPIIVDIKSDLLGFQSLYELFFSRVSGLFSVTPYIALSMLGFLFLKRAHLKREQKYLVLSCILVFLLQAYIMSTFVLGGGLSLGLGQRYLINCSFFFLIGGALFMRFAPRSFLPIFGVLASLFCIHYLFLNIQIQGRLMNEFGNLTPWNEVMYNQFFAVLDKVPNVLGSKSWWSVPKPVAHIIDFTLEGLFYAFALLVFFTLTSKCIAAIPKK